MEDHRALFASATAPAPSAAPPAQHTMPPAPATAARPLMLDGHDPRADFPCLQHDLRPGVRLAYLDNAATSLKPGVVIDAVNAYNAEYPANVHRGLHALSERATEAYEQARERVARFLNVDDSAQILFTRGTTESINLVAQSWGRANLQAGDEILLTPLEHHSNLVPWQLIAQERGVRLVYTDLTPDGLLPLEVFDRAITPRTRLVAVSGMSNVLGTIPDIAAITRLAHDRSALVLVDGAQSVPHTPTDVAAADVDFLAFSGHKMLGPTGIGVLYGKRRLLEAMPPYQGGGSMILSVEPERSTWNEIPWKFEAGTPPIAEAIGLGAAVDYLERVDWEALVAHEQALTRLAHEALSAVPGLAILGPAPDRKGGIVSFTIAGVHPHDLAQIADRFGVAIRAGHHCTMPLHRRLGVPASARASFALYNTEDDLDPLLQAIHEARRLFRA